MQAVTKFKHNNEAVRVYVIKAYGAVELQLYRFEISSLD
jgi:hypothetical protein